MITKRIGNDIRIRWAGIPEAGVSRRCLLFGAHLDRTRCAVGSAIDLIVSVLLHE